MLFWLFFVCIVICGSHGQDASTCQQVLDRLYFYRWTIDPSDDVWNQVPEDVKCPCNVEDAAEANDTFTYFGEKPDSLGICYHSGRVKNSGRALCCYENSTRILQRTESPNRGSAVTDSDKPQYNFTTNMNNWIWKGHSLCCNGSEDLTKEVRGNERMRCPDLYQKKETINCCQFYGEYKAEPERDCWEPPTTTTESTVGSTATETVTAPPTTTPEISTTSTITVSVTTGPTDTSASVPSTPKPTVPTVTVPSTTESTVITKPTTGPIISTTPKPPITTTTVLTTSESTVTTTRVPPTTGPTVSTTPEPVIPTTTILPTTESTVTTTRVPPTTGPPFSTTPEPVIPTTTILPTTESTTTTTVPPTTGPTVSTTPEPVIPTTTILPTTESTTTTTVPPTTGPTVSTTTDSTTTTTIQSTSEPSTTSTPEGTTSTQTPEPTFSTHSTPTKPPISTTSAPPSTIEPTVTLEPSTLSSTSGPSTTTVSPTTPPSTISSATEPSSTPGPTASTEPPPSNTTLSPNSTTRGTTKVPLTTSPPPEPSTTGPSPPTPTTTSSPTTQKPQSTITSAGPPSGSPLDMIIRSLSNSITKILLDDQSVLHDLRHEFLKDGTYLQSIENGSVVLHFLMPSAQHKAWFQNSFLSGNTSRLIIGVLNKNGAILKATNGKGLSESDMAAFRTALLYDPTITPTSSSGIAGWGVVAIILGVMALLIFSAALLIWLFGLPKGCMENRPGPVPQDIPMERGQLSRSRDEEVKKRHDVTSAISRDEEPPLPTSTPPRDPQDETTYDTIDEVPSTDLNLSTTRFENPYFNDRPTTSTAAQHPAGVVGARRPLKKQAPVAHPKTVSKSSLRDSSPSSSFSSDTSYERAMNC